MTDPKTAALAEAIALRFHAEDDRHDPDDPDDMCEEDAAAILAALPADWCGHDPDDETLVQPPDAWAELERMVQSLQDLTALQAATIARLRRIEEAAREWDAAYEAWADSPTVATLRWSNTAHDAFRAALGDYTVESRYTATDAFPGVEEKQPMEHGYTCGWCEWGRPDQPRSKADYDRHVQETGHRGEKP